MNHNDVKDFVKLYIKELLAEELKIEVNKNNLFGTLDIEVKFDDEVLTTASIWGSDIENLLER